MPRAHALTSAQPALGRRRRRRAALGPHLLRRHAHASTHARCAPRSRALLRGRPAAGGGIAAGRERRERWHRRALGRARARGVRVARRSAPGRLHGGGHRRRRLGGELRARRQRCRQPHRRWAAAAAARSGRRAGAALPAGRRSACVRPAFLLAYLLTCLLRTRLLTYYVLTYLLVCMLAYLHTCLPASNPVALACSPTSCVLQAVGGAALTAGDGGAAYIWDVRSMQLGGALQVSQPAGQSGSRQQSVSTRSIRSQLQRRAGVYHRPACSGSGHASSFLLRSAGGRWPFRARAARALRGGRGARPAARPRRRRVGDVGGCAQVVAR